MRLAQHTRERALLPKMTNVPVFLVEPPGVHPLSSVKRLCYRIHALRNRDIVNVVRHKGICTDHQSIHGTSLGEEIKVEATILFVAKDIQSTTAPLNKMVRHLWNDYASFSSHLQAVWWDNQRVAHDPRYCPVQQGKSSVNVTGSRVKICYICGLTNTCREQRHETGNGRDGSVR
jgi:hypothetical protein